MRKAKIIILSALFMLDVPALARDPLPVESFASTPTVSQVRLSPDGRHLVFLVNIDTPDVKGVAVRKLNIDTGDISILAWAEDKEYLITRIRWANNEQLLVSARYPGMRGRTPTTETRLLLLHAETREMRNGLPVNWLRRLDYMPQIQDDIADMLPDDPDKILVEGPFYTRTGWGIAEVSLVKNSVTRIERGRDGVIRWVTDRQHRPRITVALDETTYVVEHRGVDEKDWQTLWEFESFTEDEVWPLSFDKDPDVLYVRAYHEGRRAVFKVRLSDPELVRELVFADDKFDVDGSLIYSERTDAVIGIRFSDDGGFTFWDPEYIALQAGLDKVLPDTNNILYSLSDDERRYVVLASSDTDAGSYYLGDRDTKRLLQIARRYPDLPSEIMAPKKKISYEARDGLTIEGFLTLPPERDDAPLPAVVFPHGGPISHDDGGFDYWTQFFANRGYAVLQMNFRGSGGYGYEFMAAGLQGWGLEMQNDVEDGTRWLIAEGIADPQRICIVGASYGGYAALMEAARNPDLYQCAVSFAGVTDVAYLVASHRNFTNYELVKEQVGSNSRELRERSPLHNAEAIDIPVLLGHGTKDRSVHVRHSMRMHRELEKAGKDVTYLEFKDGNHYLSAQEHRTEFFRAMDAFLREHL